MSACLVEEASISAHLLAKGLDAKAIAEDPSIRPVIVNALEAFKRNIEHNCGKTDRPSEQGPLN